MLVQFILPIEEELGTFWSRNEDIIIYLIRQSVGHNVKMKLKCVCLYMYWNFCTLEYLSIIGICFNFWAILYALSLILSFFLSEIGSHSNFYIPVNIVKANHNFLLFIRQYTNKCICTLMLWFKKNRYMLF